MKIYKSKINCSNSVYALNDIYNVIKNYGNKYFDAKKYYNYVVLTIFDVGSYTISYYDDITSEEIVVKSLDDPTEEVRTFHSISELKDWLDRVINVRNQSYDEFNNLNSNSYKLNYITPDMKELKRAISKIVVDNDKEFIDLIDAILNDEPINEVPEVRSLHRAINRCVVDSDEELRDLILQVAADVGVISDIHSIHEETSNPYNKQTNYIANNLTFCPNCHGDRFNDKTGLCLDCGYDEKSWSDGPYYDQEYDDFDDYDHDYGDYIDSCEYVKAESLNYKDRFNDLSDELVPTKGQSDSVAGELLRAVNHIYYRYYNDGDKINYQYGCETVNPPARYIIQNGSTHLKQIVSNMWADDPYIDSVPNNKYESLLNNLIRTVVDYVVSNSELRDKKSNNMWDYTTPDDKYWYYEDEDEYEYDYEDEDDSITSANNIGYSDYNDPRLQPPEYNEPVEEDSQIETIELTLIQVPITVDNEGYWEYGDVQWSRNPESANGNWYSEDNIEINTPIGIQEDVDKIIEKYIPGYAGRYTISCDIELIYNIDNIQANYDYYGPDDYDRTVLTDEAEVEFNENDSVVSNFSYSEIK